MLVTHAEEGGEDGTIETHQTLKSMLTKLCDSPESVVECLTVSMSVTVPPLMRLTEIEYSVPSSRSSML